ncbi:dipeptide ABC transporter ATP-binding protein [Nocardia brasiliensis]|uniref:Dipeptide ABC transporter ATP-binding protein n=1 Tax=Nocardia brasiliensis TaxID=37326 RepID=A0A6G9XQ32_NOCBR|nr:dipeptide ABC transporter ATP-binding protein [Nocardia brasiliensis]
MTQPLLEVSELRVAFGDTTAVHGADLVIQPGERVAVVGASGSGKSTLAHAIMGLLPGSGHVTGGTLRWRGEDITHADEKRLRKLRGREIGLVPQDPMSNLNPVARVGRQVSETLLAHRLCSRREARGRAIELLGQAGLPEPARRARQYPHEFSGGMRQRALIAIGLACRPDLLIADEPTSALDVTVQRQILDHLEKLTQELGTALLLVTHDLGLAAERADRVIVMSDGRIVETGPARQVLTDPQEQYTQRLVAAAPALIGPRRDEGVTVDSAAADKVATNGAAAAVSAEKSGADSAAKADYAKSSPILEVSHISKEYRIRGRGGVLKAVDDVSFTIERGRTTAIVGESGSGKTTTARMVLGLVPVSSGTVRLDGAELGGLRGARLRAARRAMQPVFQDPYASLDPMWTVEKLIGEPLRAFGVGDRTARRARVAELLEQVALPAAVAHRYPNELSGGQRQRVAIARALAVGSPLVVCDEAVSALDVLVQDQILTLLSSLQQQLGVSYLFISHDLAVVRAIAHDVLVMRDGKVVEQGPAEKVFATPSDLYTRQLLDAIPGVSLVEDVDLDAVTTLPDADSVEAAATAEADSVTSAEPEAAVVEADPATSVESEAAVAGEPAVAAEPAAELEPTGASSAITEKVLPETDSAKAAALAKLEEAFAEDITTDAAKPEEAAAEPLSPETSAVIPALADTAADDPARATEGAADGGLATAADEQDAASDGDIASAEAKSDTAVADPDSAESEADAVAKAEQAADVAVAESGSSKVEPGAAETGAASSADGVASGVGGTAVAEPETVATESVSVESAGDADIRAAVKDVAASGETADAVAAAGVAVQAAAPAEVESGTGVDGSAAAEVAAVAAGRAAAKKTTGGRAPRKTAAKKTAAGTARKAAPAKKTAATKKAVAKKAAAEQAAESTTATEPAAKSTAGRSTGAAKKTAAKKAPAKRTAAKKTAAAEADGATEGAGATKAAGAAKKTAAAKKAPAAKKAAPAAKKAAPAAKKAASAAKKAASSASQKPASAGDPKEAASAGSGSPTEA